MNPLIVCAWANDWRCARVTSLKVFCALLVAVLLLPAPAADETKFVSVPFDQASGAKARASISAGDALSAFPPGRQTYGGVPFDPVTKLQLAGNTDSRDGRLHVMRSLGIAVGQRLARMHLLHAANIPGRPDQPIASLHLRYADGATQTVLITYGVQVRNYYQDNEENTVTDPGSVLAWTGPRPKGTGSPLRLYRSTFTLRSESVLEQIDAFSLFGRSSLMIFGMTGELADGSAKPGTPIASGDDTRYRDALTLKVLKADGTPVPDTKVRGVAFDATNAPTTLGQMDDTVTEAGVVPVDFPARTRELRLVVTARGFVPAEPVLTAAPGGGFNRTITVNLDRGTRIGGIVTDPDGRPVEKAKVGVFRVTRDAAGQPELLRYAEPTTDKRGRWTVYETPESLENLRFQVTHPDYRERAVDFSGDGTGTLTRRLLLASKAELQFQPPATIAGRVRDAAGQALAGIEVTLLRTNVGKLLTAQILTDAQGRFTFPAIESSRARLVVNDPRFAPTAYLINLDQPPAPLDLTLTAGHPLKLRAVEAPTRLNRAIGPSIPGVVFTVVDVGTMNFLNARADARGETVWEKPLQHSSEATNGVEGKILVRTERVGGFRAGAAWVDPNAGEALVPMEKWFPWKIRAIDEETKQPILNFTTLNSRPPTFQDKFGPSRAVNGEALGGYFAETFIHERVLTIEAEGYETLRFPLMPELGATNTYELKRKPAVAP